MDEDFSAWVRGNVYCTLSWQGAKNERLEITELENAAPNCRTGKRENGLVMESRP